MARIDRRFRNIYQSLHQEHHESLKTRSAKATDAVCQASVFSLGKHTWRSFTAISKTAGVSLQETGIIFSDTVPHFGDPLNMETFRRFLEADGIEVVIIDPVYLCLPCDINPANRFRLCCGLRLSSYLCV